MRHFIRFPRLSSPLVQFVLLWVLPVTAWAGMRTGWQQAVCTLLAQLLLLALYSSLKDFISGAGLRRLLVVVLNLLGAVFVLLQVITIGYLLVQGFPLDPFFALDNTSEALPTLYNSFDWLQLTLGTALVLAAWAFLCWRLGRTRLHWPLHGRRKLRLLQVFLPLAAVLLWANMAQFTLIKASIPLLMNSARLSDEKPGSGQDIGAVTLRYRPVTITDKRPVFILQLESVNAMAIAGMATPDVGRDRLMPVLGERAREGVFVPFMWGASMQTHSGKGAILCSAVMDLYAGVSMGSTMPSGCLPAVLAKAGYYTFFSTAHSEPNFAKGKTFMTSIGFKETHFADLMRKRDTKYGWGYDDCDFYERTFDYLDRHYGKKNRQRIFRLFRGDGQPQSVHAQEKDRCESALRQACQFRAALPEFLCGGRPLPG